MYAGRVREGTNSGISSSDGVSGSGASVFEDVESGFAWACSQIAGGWSMESYVAASSQGRVGELGKYPESAFVTIQGSQ